MKTMKRLFDLISSTLLLALLLIPLTIIALISALTQGRPILLSQNRYGKDGKVIHVLKFRTMKNTAPNVASNDLDESFITKWGSILRKTSIDELPQLINIIMGDMSVVGPRPLIVEETEIHQMRTKAGIYAVRPGLTGWAQINGRDDVTIEEKVALDKYYIDHQSIWFDLMILFQSIAVVALHKGVRK